jgi:hypothetical protein
MELEQGGGCDGELQRSSPALRGPVLTGTPASVHLLLQCENLFLLEDVGQGQGAPQRSEAAFTNREGRFAPSPPSHLFLFVLFAAAHDGICRA